MAALAPPRRILVMVKAGPAVDAVLEELAGHLDEGDLLIDGGNSWYEDTVRRERAMADRGLRFLGTGVSGGEEGALNGPSIMPGGSPRPTARRMRETPMASPRCAWRRQIQPAHATSHCPAGEHNW